MDNKCIGYIRVSSDRQDNSLQVQEQRIKEYCQFNKLSLVKILIDENISGGVEIFKRPEGKKLLDLKDIKDIVFLKPDRAFRSVSDALITLDKWNKENITSHYADAGGNSLSTKTAIGRLMFTTIISFAEFEKNITGERTKAVLNDRKNNNKTYCAALYGFDNVNGTLTKNETEQKIILDIMRMNELRMNNSQIATTLNNQGVKTKKGKAFQGSTIQGIIKNHKMVVAGL